MNPRVASLNLRVQVHIRELRVQILTRAFNCPTRGFILETCAFSPLTRGFEIVTRSFELVTCRFELATQGFVLVTCKFELVAHVLLFHKPHDLKTLQETKTEAKKIPFFIWPLRSYFQ